MGNLGAPEILIILAILVLLFGAKKLPELARGAGQSLKIFKDEVKADDEPKDAAELESTAVESPAPDLSAPDLSGKKPEQQQG